MVATRSLYGGLLNPRPDSRSGESERSEIDSFRYLQKGRYGINESYKNSRLITSRLHIVSVVALGRRMASFVTKFGT